MAGKKGLSGRKSLKDEEKRLRVIERSWEILEQFLNDTETPLKLRAELASRIAVKDVPSQIDASVVVQEMNDIVKENRIQEFLVGENTDVDN